MLPADKLPPLTCSACGSTRTWYNERPVDAPTNDELYQLPPMEDRGVWPKAHVQPIEEELEDGAIEDGPDLGDWRDDAGGEDLPSQRLLKALDGLEWAAIQDTPGALTQRDNALGRWHDATPEGTMTRTDRRAA